MTRASAVAMGSKMWKQEKRHAAKKKVTATNLEEPRLANENYLVEEREEGYRTKGEDASVTYIKTTESKPGARRAGKKKRNLMI